MVLNKGFLFFCIVFCFLFSCKQNDKVNLTLKFSFKADSLLTDTFSVDPVVDSLKQMVLNSKNDTTRIWYLNELAFHWGKDPGFILANEALHQSKAIHYYYGLTDATCKIGNVFYRKTKFDSAQKYFDESRRLAIEKNFINLKEQADYWLGDLIRVKQNDDSALVCLQKTAASAKASENKIILGYAYYSIGEINRVTGLNSEAIRYCELALPIFEELNLKRRKALCFSCIADSYNMVGDYNKALEYCLKAIPIIEYLKDEAQLGLSYSSLGQIYFAQSNSIKAKEYYTRALVLLRKQGNKSYLMYSLAAMGQVLRSENQFEKAETLYKETIDIAHELKDRRKEAECLALLGQLSTEQEKHDESLNYYKASLKLAEEIGDKNMEVFNHTTIGSGLLVQNKYAAAVIQLEKALQLAVKYESPIQVRDASGLLYRAYEAQHQIDKAFKTQSLFMQMKDSITNEEQIQKFAGIEYQAKENKLKSEQEKKNVEYNAEQIKQESEIHRQKTVRNAFVAGFVFLLVLAFVIFRSLQQNKQKNRIITEQKEILEHQKSEITDSINYAKRIQNAILPDKNDINKYLPDSFGLYKPKDIVSGDFYYFKEKNNKLFFAVGDCTGHGVPGAFMSVVGSKELQIAVERSDKPGEILSILNKGVKQALKQNTADATKDGMDISICRIDGKKLTYSGANRQLWIIRKDSTVIEEYPPTKTAIGGFTEDDHVFAEHNIDLNQGDNFYLFTDGYADQFGGDKQKKMTTKRFKEALLSVQKLSMDDQKSGLESYFLKWKGTLEQVDDVLIVGVRV